MIGAISASTAGMARAQERFATGAARVSQAGAGQASAAPGVDLSAEAADLVKAKLDFEANAAVLRVADDMRKRLLDIVV